MWVKGSLSWVSGLGLAMGMGIMKFRGTSRFDLTGFNEATVLSIGGEGVGVDIRPVMKRKLYCYYSNLVELMDYIQFTYDPVLGCLYQQ